MRLWCALVLAGCGFPSIDGEVVYQGKHIELHADPSLPVCTDSIKNADALLEATAQLLGAPVPEVEFTLYGENVDVCSAGGASADCTAGTHVYSGRWPHDHELIHTVAAAFGRSPAFLAEGLAEGLTAGPPDRIDRAVPPIDSVEFFSGDIGGHYAAAADFTRYLLSRFGTERYLRLYQEELFFDDAITTRITFEHVMGVPFDQVVADWQSTPEANVGLASFSRCTGETLPETSPGSWVNDEVADCLQSSGSQSLSQSRRHMIDVAAPSVVSLQMTKPDGVSVLVDLYDCAGRAQLLSLGDVRRMSLRLVQAGRYAVDVAQIGTEVKDAPTHWALEERGPASGSCDTATVIQVPTIATYIVQMSGYSSEWSQVGNSSELWLRVDGIPADKISTSMFGAPSFEVCTGTCGALSCVDARSLHDSPLGPQQPLYIHGSLPVAVSYGAFTFQLFY